MTKLLLLAGFALLLSGCAACSQEPAHSSSVSWEPSRVKSKQIEYMGYAGYKYLILLESGFTCQVSPQQYAEIGANTPIVIDPKFEDCE